MARDPLAVHEESRGAKGRQRVNVYNNIGWKGEEGQSVPEAHCLWWAQYMWIIRPLHTGSGTHFCSFVVASFFIAGHGHCLANEAGLGLHGH